MPIPQALLDKVPAEKRASLDAALSGLDDFIKEMESGYMRQSDYSVKMNAWQTEKTVMTENYNKAKAQYDSMYEDWQKGEASLTELKAAKDKAEDLEKELTTLRAASPAIDPSKIVTPEQLSTQLNTFGAGQVSFFTEAMDVAYEIEGLLQKRISPGTLLTEALAAKKTPKLYAEEKFELVKKREERAVADKAAEEKRLREDERSKVIAEMSNPATRTLSDSKDPFFSTRDDKGPKQPWELTETPADEQKILQELTQAAGR